MGDETYNNTMAQQKPKSRKRDLDDDNTNQEVEERYWPRFLLIKSAEEDRPVSRLSPFVIFKGLKGLAGELKTIKKNRSGDILVECHRKGQSDNLLRTNKLADCPIEVIPHNSLNSSKGVIRSKELKGVSEEEMLNNLNHYGVTNVKRISVKKEGNTIVTNTIILTFGTPVPPTCIIAGYIKIEVTPYVPNPLRCFNC